MDLNTLFPGDSELAQRMRRLDWTQTALGDPKTWPEHLRIAVRICLTSRFPMHVWWGPSLTLLYNDAYVSFLGRFKHPAALGRSGHEAWAEIWPQIGPMIDNVLNTGVASWSEDIQMFIDRELSKEEMYATFSFSPILGPTNRVDGLFCACTETTEKIIANRQMETLRQLGARASDTQGVHAACTQAAAVLSANPHDIPFACIYVAEGDEAVRAATAGRCQGLPEHARVTDSSPLGRVLRYRRAEVVDVHMLGLQWPQLGTRVMILPLPHGGLLVTGVSATRPLDAKYRAFFELVAQQIGAAIDDAKAYETEKKRAEALAELDRGKTAFFSNVSHEFRTPLTLILGPLEEMLTKLPQGHELVDQLQVVQRSALRLVRLVNALLDFSAIEAGRARPSFERVDLGALTAEIASVFRSAVERAGLQFNVSTESLAGPVTVDQDMWEKILLNLLSNAFKFTFVGGIDVSLRPCGDRVQLQVTDTGAGIPAEELPHLFERFHRVEGARARTHEGSGIGLALVQDLARIHGGDVQVESTLGVGSTFTVSIPYGDDRSLQSQAAHRQRNAPIYAIEATRWLPDSQGALNVAVPCSEQVRAGSERSSEHILIADDNADMRAYLVRLLSEHWTVTAVPDGEAALSALNDAHFDLVLTDVMMPRMDGVTLVQRIRSDVRLKTTPVIMLSARVGSVCSNDGLDAGADDYLVKPFAAREVIARIRTHLKLVERRNAVEANRAKDEFIAMLGHELRNPLAPIITALEVIKMRSHGDISHEEAIIARQAEHLVRLVDDLLDVARIARGKIALRKHVLRLSDVVTRAAEMVMPLFEQRRHRLEVRVPDDLYVDGDESRLAQVLGNLLHNSAKYTEPGGDIALTVARDGAVHVIRVSDNGGGIAPELLDHVFELFTQAPQSNARARGGLGIGLTIVRSIVELHGGTVDVYSAGVGQGACFTVRLPACEEAPSCQMNRRPRLVSKRSRRVLLVDDNEDALFILATLLKRAGHEVETALDGPSAIEMAKAFTPEVAVLDIGLPVMDGCELAEHLRAELGALAPRLIALTGYGQSMDRARTRSAGFIEHLTKPAEGERLLEAIEAAVGGIAA